MKSVLGDREYVVATIAKEGQEKGVPVYVVGKQKVGDSTPGQVAQLVKDIRSSVCNALKKGDELKFTMAWDASGKVWGIGIGGSSGIEVMIKC